MKKPKPTTTTKCWYCNCEVSDGDDKDAVAAQHDEECAYALPPIEANAHVLDDEIDGLDALIVDDFARMFIHRLGLDDD